MNEKFSITNTTKSKIPSLPFVEIKNKILGKKYFLSLVFIGDQKSKQLNNSYRGKNTATNCLSFSLNKNNGEIFVNLNKAKKDAKKFDKNYKNFVIFLFIHSLLHLKGMKHSSTMEKAEEKLCKQFSL